MLDQCDKLPYDSDWEFPREKLNFIRLIGSGAFGEVWLAKAEGILDMDPRNKTKDASESRLKKKSQLKSGRKAGRSPKDCETLGGGDRTLVAVKILKGMVYLMAKLSSIAKVRFKTLCAKLSILFFLSAGCL